MKRKTAKKSTFFVILILILTLTFLAFFGVDNYFGDIRKVYIKGAEDIRWGIDINGGVEAVFVPDDDDIEVTENDMNSIKNILETRLVNQNITDYEIYVDGRQVTVRFPWSADESTFDAHDEIEKLGQTAIITFCGNYDRDNVLLQGSEDIASARASVDYDNQPIVILEFTEQGKAKFSDAAKQYQGQVISIWLDDDDEYIAAPTVGSNLSGQDEIYIELENSTIEWAQDLAEQINGGSLPFALSVDESKLQVISPTLGSNALNVMLIAGAVAFVIVCVIVIIRYRIVGVVASIALLGQIAGSIACISGFFPGVDSFTLTIPGIAGIILSIGVGVDCNVIAAERIRDEFARGKTIDGAINSGYKNSLSAIIDGNVTIIIVSVVLMGAFGSPDSLLGKIFSPIMSLFGSSITGSIYSFGYTLLVGVIFNLIMGVLASKYMTGSLSKFNALRKPELFGGKKNG